MSDNLPGRVVTPKASLAYSEDWKSGHIVAAYPNHGMLRVWIQFDDSPQLIDRGIHEVDFGPYPAELRLKS